ncbi:hypothetical protein ACNOYE_35310 [Nannocystaceae bacterium ST9]
MSNPLREIDLYLLRHHPNLWALRLPHLFAAMAVLSLGALVVASSTTVELNEMPAVGRTYIVWLLLAVVLFGYWAVLFMRIRPPVLERGTAARAFAIVGVLIACATSWMPAVVYIAVLEARMRAEVEPLKDEIRTYHCLTEHSNRGRLDEAPSSYLGRPMDDQLCFALSRDHMWWKEYSMCAQYSPSAEDEASLARDGVTEAIAEEFESHCFDRRGGLPYMDEYDATAFRLHLNADVRARIEEYVETKIVPLALVWGHPFSDRRWGLERVSNYRLSMMLEISLGESSSLYGSFFPYHRHHYRLLVLFIMGYLAYLLSFARHAPRMIFVWALVVVGGLFALVWVGSTISPIVLRGVPAAHIGVWMIGFTLMVWPEKYGKYAFLFELWLCMIPLMGISFVLARDVETYVNEESLIEYGAFVCWATLVVSPLLHVVAERYRSQPK